MARITFSPLVTAASGKVKDTVFSKWKGRAYIRARVVPANPQSVDQMAVRDSMSRVVELWQSLSAATKEAWAAYASPYSLSGYNAFVSANRAAEQIPAVLLMSPMNPLVPDMVPLSVGSGASSGTIKVQWDKGSDTGTDDMVVAFRRQDTNVLSIASIGDYTFQDEEAIITGIVVGTFTDVYLWRKSTLDIPVLYAKSAGMLHVPEGAA
jgi:hypothetical protein